MGIDNYRVAFSIRLDPCLVKKAALIYPDKTVLEALFFMGVLDLKKDIKGDS